MPPEANETQQHQILSQQGIHGMLAKLSASKSLIITSVNDPPYVTKMEKALIKTFDYLHRKDTGEVFGPGPGSKTGGNKAPAHNKANHQTKLGVGVAAATAATSAAAAAATAAAAAAPVEMATAVYVAGLPLDFTNEEIGERCDRVLINIVRFNLVCR
jgi:hypothetical protein